MDHETGIQPRGAVFGSHEWIPTSAYSGSRAGLPIDLGKFKKRDLYTEYQLALSVVQNVRARDAARGM